MTIRQLSTRVVYRNQWMNVREAEIERSNGAHGIYGVVEKADSAILLPIADGRVFMVEQYRYPIGENSLEFPQGSLERSGVDPAEIARQELQAETGLIAQELECLGMIHIACAYTNQKTYAFLATGLTQAGGVPDFEEHDLAVRTLTLDELKQRIRNNEIKDAQTIAAWALYQTCVAELRTKP